MLGTAKVLTSGDKWRRRAVLAAATLLVVALVVAVRVQVARSQARSFYPPERVTTASHGRPADYLDYRWWLAGVRQERQVFLPRGMVHVTMTVRVQPLTAAAVAKAVRNPLLGVSYEFRHPGGAVMSAGQPRGRLSYALNQPTQFTIEGDVPEAIAGALGLQVRVPWSTKLGSETKQRPRTSDPVLRLWR